MVPRSVADQIPLLSGALSIGTSSLGGNMSFVQCKEMLDKFVHDLSTIRHVAVFNILASFADLGIYGEVHHLFYGFGILM